MANAPPDYTAMSGAQFQRAVGADPERWAEACLDALYYGEDVPTGPGKKPWKPEHIAVLAQFFRDFADAAVRAQGQLLNWDKDDDGR